MISPAISSISSVLSSPVSGFLDRVARKLVFDRLRCLSAGQVAWVDGSERLTFGSSGGLEVAVHVNDARVYSHIAFGGSIGAAESFMRGWWDCDDLTSLVRIFLRNRKVLNNLEAGVARLAMALHRRVHSFRKNTKDGSLQNISAHYDLGNEFYSLFLDANLMYSGAIFKDEKATLEEAQVLKNKRICAKLVLSPDDHLLEIGTGWGGFAEHAATHHGCRVTTTTISEEQYRYAVRRIADAGLAGRVTVLFQDYRGLAGRFDKIVSIEMIEAVGHHYYDEYFRRCSALLKDDGMMLLQGIIIADQEYDRARREVDFIQRYIFPGSCIPSVQALLNSVIRSTDMRLHHLEDIGLHYATTLRHWRSRFRRQALRVRQLGFSEEFIRMWEYYFCYCEGGFLERSIGDVQMLLAKPRALPTRHFDF